MYQEQQQLLAKAIQAEGIAEATGIQEMNNALAGSGGEAIQGKRIILLPVSEGGHESQDNKHQPLVRNISVKSLSGGQ